MLKKETTLWRSSGVIVVTVPSQISNDSAFPFERGEKLLMEIKGKSLVISKL